MVTQGTGWAAGPPRSFPAAATTTTPPSAAPSSARSTVSISGGPPTDRLSTSTPSAVARSTAVTRSAVAQPSPRGSGALQHALYTATRASGACPPKRPSRSPSTRTGTPALPAASAAIWVPWPSSSSGESDVVARTASLPNPATNHRAPAIFPVHASAQPSPS